MADKIKIDLSNLPDRTNTVYLKLYENSSRYLVLMGGGGSGKSVFAAQKIIYRMLCETPHRILVVRKVAKTMRESVFALLKGTIYDWGLAELFSFNKSELSITCKNGNEILMAGLDDVEKLKSIYNITTIWIEEASELEAEDFRQLDIRLRGMTAYYKQIIFSFNPVSITHWLKAEFFDVDKPDTTTSHTTYKDNKFLDEEAIRVLESFKNTDPYYYQVYCCGEWGVLGKTVFDAQRVSERIMQVRPVPKRKGQMKYDKDTGAHYFSDDINGGWTVYKEPEEGHKYIIGADVAEGTKDGDFDAAQVLDANTYEQCAVFHDKVDIDTYAEELCKGGYYYNSALITPEVNFNPGLVLNLERMKYPRLYMRQIGDSVVHEIQFKYGFRTDKYNRQAIISDCVEFVRDYVEFLHDIPTLEEMLTFVRDDRGKPQAQEGKHDDLVMALAIGLHACMSGQGGTSTVTKKVDISKLPPDCQEDYNKASPEIKIILEEKWGLKRK